jgi:hypothetical protein
MDYVTNTSQRTAFYRGSISENKAKNPLEDLAQTVNMYEPRIVQAGSYYYYDIKQGMDTILNPPTNITLFPQTRRGANRSYLHLT